MYLRFLRTVLELNVLSLTALEMATLFSGLPHGAAVVYCGLTSPPSHRRVQSLPAGRRILWETLQAPWLTHNWQQKNMKGGENM